MTSKFYRLLAILTALVTAAALMKGMSLPEIGGTFPEGEVAEITEITEADWSISEDGRSASYTVSESLSEAQVLEITGNWTSFEIRLEDTLLYSFDDEYQELGRALHWIEIPANSGGKRIVAAFDSEEALKKTLNNPDYLGTADAVRHRFFMKNLPFLLLTVVDLLMAAVVILVLVVLRRSLSSELVLGVWDLFCFTILNGIWLISDCGFLECFTASTGLWALVSYITFMLMPVFMVRFSQRLLTHRRRFLYVLGTASLCLTSATLILYLTRVAPLGTLLIFHQAVMVLDYIMIFIFFYHELRHYRIKRLEAICVGVVLMGVAMCFTGATYWMGMNTLYPLIFDTGFTCYIICLTISVVRHAYYSLEKKAEADMYRKLAYKDMMTALYNRSAFTEYQNRASGGIKKSACIMFDLNDLKLVNDTLGHHMGDDLIMRAAGCIREAFEGCGNCYRIGGDEFMTVLGNIRSESEVQSLLEHFEKRVSASNSSLKEGQPPLSIAYGCSLAGDEPRTLEEMYKEADARMYEKKCSMKKTAAE